MNLRRSHGSGEHPYLDSIELYILQQQRLQFDAREATHLPEILMKNFNLSKKKLK